ncbi:DUF1997 domain-containing protein [Pseudanabaena sp. PCC 6802]|uniref:DUF1997 domain-containing protein n=1 Tax=Pseudanabaena sp. PCC 6802 TaxID=118173 RepID=UPI00034C53D0|nr:DUF1997 domain-containing protein [Pseudanabaena sp. PCC 6802]
MVAEFYASESTSIAVPSRSIPIAHYLRQPQRVVNAVTEKSRVELIKHSTTDGHSIFRLKMQPLGFLQVTIQPTVDLDVWADPDGTVHMRSMRTQIRGTDWIDRRFALKLAGKIAPQVDRHSRTRLVGRVELKVNVELPPIFFMTPAVVLEATGNSLLRSVLLTMKRRLVQRLVADYLDWAKNGYDLAATKGSAIEII